MAQTLLDIDLALRGVMYAIVAAAGAVAVFNVWANARTIEAARHVLSRAFSVHLIGTIGLVSVLLRIVDAPPVAVDLAGTAFGVAVSLWLLGQLDTRGGE